MKHFGEKEAWAYAETAQIFWVPPIILRTGKATDFKFGHWPVHSEVPSEQKSIKNFREKGAWAYPRTAQFVRVPPLISGTGKATHFKFGHWPVHSEGPSEQKPIKIFGEKGVWAYPGTAHNAVLPSHIVCLSVRL